MLPSVKMIHQNYCRNHRRAIGTPSGEVRIRLARQINQNINNKNIYFGENQEQRCVEIIWSQEFK